MSKQDTLVVTPTLGTRNDSLKRTVDAVAKIGGLRVKHVLTAPLNKCEELKTVFPKLEVIPEPEGCRSIYTALNYAINNYIKEFKYFTYINDDDYWLPDFQILFEALDNDDSVDVAYGRTSFVDDKNIFIGEQTSAPFYKSFGSLLRSNIVLFTQQATLIKGEWFIKLKGFDEGYKLIADTDFWFRAVSLGASFKYVRNVCAAYTIQDSQLSSNSTLQSTEHIELLRKNNISDNRIKSIFVHILFRLYNSQIYIKRFLKGGTLNSSSRRRLN